jgi:ADP-ribosyl-[dinitrogen reductase] hydrolase
MNGRPLRGRHRAPPPVNLGDDAGTTGAICGQLAGTFWGESNIPERLRSGLARMDMIESALAGILAGIRKAE